jgi:hypothetical protein
MFPKSNNLKYFLNITFIFCFDSFKLKSGKILVTIAIEKIVVLFTIQVAIL